eukprot:gene275-3650_t
MNLVAKIFLLATIVAPKCDCAYLDEFTDFNPYALRYLPRGTMWQVFSAGWNSQLSELRVYLGMEAQCEQVEAILYIAEREHSDIKTVKKEALASPVSIVMSCENATCVDKIPEKQCAAWQRFILPHPITVTANSRYTFGLEVASSQDYEPRRPVIGVSPRSENHGGKSSLAVSPIFPTQYTQFAFKTLLATSKPRLPGLNQQTVEPHASSESTLDELQQENSGNSRIGVAGIVVPIFVVLLVIFATIFFLLQRRRWKQDKIVDSSHLYSVREDDFEEQDIAIRNHSSDARHTVRHPIFVRTVESEEESNDRQRWAERSLTYGTYTRRLPDTPRSSNC